MTRHLRAFFPNAALYVSDLAKEKEKFVLQSFGANQAEQNPEFLIPPHRTYDLIFVGSLVTHFDEPRFRRAINWFVASLSPKGLLVLTTHGRRHNYMQNKVTNYIAPDLWRNAQQGYDQTGFGYVELPDIPSYGLSASSPSWIAKMIEGFTGYALAHVPRSGLGLSSRRRGSAEERWLAWLIHSHEATMAHTGPKSKADDARDWASPLARPHLTRLSQSC